MFNSCLETSAHLNAYKPFCNGNQREAGGVILSLQASELSTRGSMHTASQADSQKDKKNELTLTMNRILFYLFFSPKVKSLFGPYIFH